MTPAADRRLEAARGILEEFGDATGLTSDRPTRRYLWTDAFAVCAWLGVHVRTGGPDPLERALALVDQVHAVLGRHRDDDPRTGWISGLSEEEGRRHPTAGGLRIGKPLPERPRGEPVDSRVEWDRDGQYYHYLTRWMHALRRVAEVTGEARFHRWAVELAEAAHAGFRHVPPGGGPVRLYWKMSVDLSRPLVASMGAHDPLDGLVTCLSLRASAPDAPTDVLPGAVSELEETCRGRSWASDDALGIGGLLLDLFTVVGLRVDGHDTQPLTGASLADDALRSLEAWRRSGMAGLPARHRLAFRELGLALGLRAVHALAGAAPRSDGGGRAPLEERLALLLEALSTFTGAADELESFWLDPSHRKAPTWVEHRDINAVSLAACLVPEGWLGV